MFVFAKLFVAFVSVVHVFWVPAGDWPQFRGPKSDGVVIDENSPTEWSDTKNVAWKVKVPGLGWSSPVIRDGRIFITTAVQEGDGLSLRAMALDATNGQVIWDREVRSIEKVPAIHKKNSHASPTPILADDSVFVYFGAQGMARLSAADGSIQWTCFELEYPPAHGNGGSPVLHDGKLVIVCDGSQSPFVAAINASTGKVDWKTPRSVLGNILHSFVTPTIAVVDNHAQVLAPGAEHMAAYDLASGKELWRVLAPGWSVVPQPAVGHGLVFYNHDYDNPELMAVKLGGKGDVTESNVVWRTKRGAPSTPSPLLIGDELYFIADNGVATCVDAKTGNVHWTERLDGNYSASPTLVNNQILFLNEEGLSTWVKADKQFTSLGQNEIPGRTLATPAFADGAIYMRTDEQLYKFANSEGTTK
jgi:outer membrane protein assembly factor BamB